MTRVWKGEVGATFGMPAIEETSACWGFWPRLLKVGVGNDVLVYATQWPGETDDTSVFVTNICYVLVLGSGVNRSFAAANQAPA